MKSAAVLGGLLLAACSTPKHTNLLIFGTDTKIALDVSASPTTGSPNITVGYRREELALVPLVSNSPSDASFGNGVAVTPTTNGVQAGGEQKPAQCIGGGCMLVASGVSGGGVPIGPDTYSTLASFGANFDSGTNNGGATAKGGIASYFATGIAAQLLAAKGGAALVSSQQPDADPAAVAQEIVKLKAAQTTAAEKLVGEISTGGNIDKDKYANFLVKCTLPKGFKEKHSNDNLDQITKYLNDPMNTSLVNDWSNCKF
jgi:hypothetical protein